MHGVQHPEPEIHRKLQPRLPRSRLDSVAVFEQQHSKAVEPRILQRKTVFRLIHSEPARATRTRREENEVVQDLLAREPLFLEELQVLHQIANGKIRRITLAVVPEFLSRLKSRYVRNGKLLAVVPAPLEHRADQVLVFPSEAAKKNGDAAALLSGKGALDWAVEVLRLVEPRNFTQACPFCFEALSNLRLILNPNEIRCHEFLRRCAKFFEWS